MSHKVTIERFEDLYVEGAALILGHIDSKLVDIVREPKKKKELIKDTYQNTAGMAFIEKELRDNQNPTSFMKDGANVELPHSVNLGFEFKQVVDNEVDTKELKNFLSTNPDAQNYSLQEKDVEEVIKKAKSKARSIVRSCCDEYSKWLHEEYMMEHQIYVETTYTDNEFGVVAYYLTDDKMKPNKVVVCNEHRMKFRAEKDSKKIETTAVMAQDVTNRHACFKGTSFEDAANNAMKPIVDMLTAHGSKLSELGKTTRLVKSKINEPVRLEAAPVETTAETVEEEETAE